MLEFKKSFFNIGECWTYEYLFVHGGYTRKEHIHCIVEEHIILNGDLEKIKVKQIHNLEDYFINRNHENYSERILKVDSSILFPLYQWG